jgi:hypothetical protein
MEVRNVRWIGVPTRHYDAMASFLRDVMQLEINFTDLTTVEFRTTEGDEVQLMAPGDPYFEFFTENTAGPVPLFEVDDVHRARTELVDAGVEIVGEMGRDSQWEWLHFRAPDVNLYELGSRRSSADSPLEG